MNQMRAYQLQQQMFLEQERLRQEQRVHAAQQQAINQWAHIVPPDKLPQIANMIYQNAPYDQVARAAAQLSGNLIVKTDPESIAANIRYMEKVTGQPWKDPYPP